MTTRAQGDGHTPHFDVVIVGAGHGGAHTAVALRQAGFAGSIAMIGDEAHPPYERPPLSKDYLAGQKPFDRMLIRPTAFWGDKQIDMLLGRKVVGVDPVAHSVTTADGATIGYGQLVWATGGVPRRLSCAGHDLEGVHAVRNRIDVDRMVHELPTTRRVVVIGGGYIGLEAAAALSKLGKQVTVVEALDRVLARVAGEPLSRFYEAEHRAHGVDVRLNVAVECIEAKEGRTCGVRLATGEILPADMVIVGIGIIPAVQPLLDAGAEGGNGVEVDEHCRTSLPDIYVIGDCAAHRNSFADGARIRLESVQNAHDQGAVAAKAIAGVPVAYRAVPWFWSDQYDLKLQTVGLSTGFDQLVLRGDVASRSFSIIYLRGGSVIALDCVNAAKDFIQGRKLVEERVAVAVGDLTDVARSLKEIVAATARDLHAA